MDTHRFLKDSVEGFEYTFSEADEKYTFTIRLESSELNPNVLERLDTIGLERFPGLEVVIRKGEIEIRSNGNKSRKRDPISNLTNYLTMVDESNQGYFPGLEKQISTIDQTTHAIRKAKIGAQGRQYIDLFLASINASANQRELNRQGRTVDAERAKKKAKKLVEDYTDMERKYDKN